VVNCILQVGSSVEEVTVTGVMPIVNTTDSALGGMVNEQEMASLPLNGRNYSDFIFLQPGVTITQNVTGGGPQGGTRGTFSSVDGAGPRENLITLEGCHSE
jgi:hypothetical protein